MLVVGLLLLFGTGCPAGSGPRSGAGLGVRKLHLRGGLQQLEQVGVEAWGELLHALDGDG